MKAAVISLSVASGTVTNVIVADADRDYPPDKTSILVNLPDDHPATAGWVWDSAVGFSNDEKKKQPEITAAPLKVEVELVAEVAVEAPVKDVPVEAAPAAPIKGGG